MRHSTVHREYETPSRDQTYEVSQSWSSDVDPRRADLTLHLDERAPRAEVILRVAAAEDRPHARTSRARGVRLGQDATEVLPGWGVVEHDAGALGA